MEHRHPIELYDLRIDIVSYKKLFKLVFVFLLCVGVLVIIDRPSMFEFTRVIQFPEPLTELVAKHPSLRQLTPTIEEQLFKSWQWNVQMPGFFPLFQNLSLHRVSKENSEIMLLKHQYWVVRAIAPSHEMDEFNRFCETLIGITNQYLMQTHIVKKENLSNLNFINGMISHLYRQKDYPLEAILPNLFLFSGPKIPVPYEKSEKLKENLAMNFVGKIFYRDLMPGFILLFLLDIIFSFTATLIIIFFVQSFRHLASLNG